MWSEDAPRGEIFDVVVIVVIVVASLSLPSDGSKFQPFLQRSHKMPTHTKLSPSFFPPPLSLSLKPHARTLMALSLSLSLSLALSSAVGDSTQVFALIFSN